MHRGPAPVQNCLLTPCLGKLTLSHLHILFFWNPSFPPEAFSLLCALGLTLFVKSFWCVFCIDLSFTLVTFLYFYCCFFSFLNINDDAVYCAYISLSFFFMSCSWCKAICYFFGWIFETSFQLLFFLFWIWKNISILQVPENIWRSWCKPGLPDWSTFILCRFILVDEFALKWKRITLCSALSAVLYRFPLRFMLESCEIKALDRWVSFLIYKVKVKSASRTLSLTVFAVVR